MQAGSDALLYQMWSGLGWSKKLAVRFTQQEWYGFSHGQIISSKTGGQGHFNDNLLMEKCLTSRSPKTSTFKRRSNYLSWALQNS